MVGGEIDIRIQPDYVIAHDNLGDVYAKLAVKSYQKTVQLDQSKADAQSKLDIIQTGFSQGRKPAVHPGPVKSIAASTQTVNPKDEIMESINAWAAAWAAKDVDQYIAAYTDDFHPAGESHEAWKAVRRNRVERLRFIRIAPNNLSVNLTDQTHATVQFDQNYQSNLLSVISHKKLSLVLKNGKWLIQQETSL